MWLLSPQAGILSSRFHLFKIIVKSKLDNIQLTIVSSDFSLSFWTLIYISALFRFRVWMDPCQPAGYATSVQEHNLEI